ncbi:uncharacterized protein LOC110853441 isoform X2 [Folsomia candida]|nr:uncharacterized protein LOC110853441 isoform X2 [Folsomia candida]
METDFLIETESEDTFQLDYDPDYLPPSTCHSTQEKNNQKARKSDINQSEKQRIKSKRKTTQDSVRALLSKPLDNYVEDGQDATGSQNLVKQPGFESFPRFQFLFENQFNYLGHEKMSNRFFATCKRCSEMGRSKFYSFDVNNFKTNGNRHFQLSHKDVVLETKKENPAIPELSTFTQAGYSKSDPIQALFDSNLQDLISVDGLPYSFINGLGFRNLIHDLNPRLILPDRVTLARRLNNTVNTTIRPNFKTPFKNVLENNVHVTTVICTTKQGDKIIGIKCHYIQTVENPKSWTLLSKVLAAEEFMDQSSGESIEDKFQKSLSTFGIDINQIGYLVTDGKNNMVYESINEKDETIQNGDSFSDRPEMHIEEDSSDISNGSDEEDDETLDFDIMDDSGTDRNINITLGEKFRFSCFAHRFQLVVKDVLANEGREKYVLNCVCNIVKCFMRSSHWRKRLIKVLGKVLLKPALSWWNYVYYVSERLTQDNAYEEVCNLIHEASTGPRKLKKLLPNVEAKQNIVELCNLLRPISHAINQLQGDGITSSLIYYTVVTAYDEIAKTPTNLFTYMKSQLLDGLKARFEGSLTDTVVVLSALLDQRQKLDTFTFQPASFGTASLQTPTTTTVTEILGSFYESEDKEAADEMQRYLQIARQPNSDPLEFWAQNESNFPTLSKLAIRYLAIPASTGGADAFSRLLSLGRGRRSSLTPMSVQNILLHREHRLPILNAKFKLKNVLEKRVKKPGRKSNKRLKSDETA